MTVVYALREAGSLVVRYVGQSSVPRHRLVGHIRAARYAKQPTAFTEWLLSADIEVVEVSRHATVQEGRVAEKVLIAALGALGFPLFNIDGVQAARAPDAIVSAATMRRRSVTPHARPSGQFSAIHSAALSPKDAA